MPIITDKLFNDSIATIKKDRASCQEIRPLKIAILNLMPDKETTESQLLRVLSNTPLQLDITLLTTESYLPSHVDQNYLKENYTFFHEVRDQKFDAFIITGAPIELMEFEEIDYWQELCEILDYVRHNVYSTLFLCWASQAALKYYYGINKYRFDQKLSGLYSYQTLVRSDLTRGFDPTFLTPMSRYTYNKLEEIEAEEDLILYAGDEETGPNILASRDHRFIFISGHLEYDADTLKKEYFRDLRKDPKTPLPHNYFEGDDPHGPVKGSWNAHANLFFTNWLNNYVYQQTPYLLKELQPKVIAKFGGSSLSNSEQFKKVKDIIEGADRKIIVVSAPGKRYPKDRKITDLLIDYYHLKMKRKECLQKNQYPEGSKFYERMTETLKLIRERFMELIMTLDIPASLLLELEEELHELEASYDYDFIVSRGEFLNAKVLARYLGYHFLDAGEIIFFQNGEIDQKRTYEAIKQKIEKGQAYIIPGFYGQNEFGKIQLMSRGGSDITGSLIASALKADTYENWTDVSGIMTADPEKNPDASTIESMSYRQLYDIVASGAQVFNPDAVKPLFGSKVILEIKNTNSPHNKYTKVTNE